MALLKVVWTETALKQRNFIFKYWNERNRSNSYSQKLNQKIKERLNLLKSSPDLGKRVDFKNTRVLSLGHFSIFYKKMKSVIYISAFWDNRQNPEKLLIFLKGNAK